MADGNSVRGRSAEESVPDPAGTVGIDGHDVKTAGRGLACEMQSHDSGQEVAGGADQPGLLVAVYTGGSTAIGRIAAFPDFDEQQQIALAGDQVDFACAATQIARQYANAVGLQVLCGLRFRCMPLALGRGAGRCLMGWHPGCPRTRGQPSQALAAALHRCALGQSGGFVGIGRHGKTFTLQQKGSSMTDSPDWEQAGPTWKRHAELAAGQSWPAGCLYVVATPIGNLQDLSLRAWETLRRCDAVAAEDTRTTRTLLDAWGIATPLLAAHRHNERAAAEAVIGRLAQGERIALVSDAGAPAVSDPGARLVRDVQAAGYRVVPLPGPSAVITALMASGATRDDEPGFAFAGFMPSKAQARRKWLDHWLAWPVPVVMFETPHRLRAALQDLAAAAGPDRPLTVARELSKRFEEICTLPAGQALSWLDEDVHREQGEFVLVVHAGAQDAAQDDDLTPEQRRLMEALLEDLSVRDAARIGARATGLARDRLYAWALARQAG